MSNNNGILFVLLLCCGWPLIVHFGITYGLKYITQRDWKNIQWQNLRMPWSKDE